MVDILEDEYEMLPDTSPAIPQYLYQWIIFFQGSQLQSDTTQLADYRIPSETSMLKTYAEQFEKSYTWTQMLHGSLFLTAENVALESYLDSLVN